MNKTLISIVTPTKNEFQNIEKLTLEIQKTFENLAINYEHIIIDNDSTDGTIDIIKKLAKQNSKIKVILNASDYGQIRSPFYGMLQTSGDAVIFITSDFETPIEIVPELISKWEQRKYKVIFTKRVSSDESYLLKRLRSAFYVFLKKISKLKLGANITGEGIYDREVIEIFKKNTYPFQFFRAMVPELGIEYDTVEFKQIKRKL